MSVLLIAGSAAEHSRTAALLDAVAQRLGLRQALIDRVRIRELSPQALLLADTTHATLRHVLAQIASARAVVMATPVHQGAYSGVLKLLLDLLPPDGLKGKAVLPLAVGGSAPHRLALDRSLRPVLQSLGARHILAAVHASDAQLPPHAQGRYRPTPDTEQRLDDAVRQLLHEGLRMPGPNARAAAPGRPAARCSA